MLIAKSLGYFHSLGELDISRILADHLTLTPTQSQQHEMLMHGVSHSKPSNFHSDSKKGLHIYVQSSCVDQTDRPSSMSVIREIMSSLQFGIDTLILTIPINSPLYTAARTTGVGTAFQQMQIA